MLLKKELEERGKMKNKDYVKLEDVLKLFCGTCLWENDCFGNNEDEPCERYKVISSIPIQDVVEVVRCKDCTHSKLREITDEGHTVRVCENWGYVDDTHFCNDGKRRDDERD